MSITAIETHYAEDLLTDSPQVARIRRDAAGRDLVIEICAESDRIWLIDRKEKDVEQALVAEVLCPNTEPLQGLVRDDVPDLLAEIDQLRAALAAVLRGETRLPVPGPSDRPTPEITEETTNHG
jgi:hypothetical protein